jgi:hypothetical protein
MAINKDLQKPPKIRCLSRTTKRRRVIQQRQRKVSEQVTTTRRILRTEVQTVERSRGQSVREYLILIPFSDLLIIRLLSFRNYPQPSISINSRTTDKSIIIPKEQEEKVPKGSAAGNIDEQIRKKSQGELADGLDLLHHFDRPSQKDKVRKDMSKGVSIKGQLKACMF